MLTEGIATRGGGFLLADPRPDEVFISEQFTEGQRMIGRTAEEFVAAEVWPRLPDIEAGDHQTTVTLLREAGKLGLLGADVPEVYGGLGLDRVTSTLITEKLAAGGSFAISFGAHTGIGTLPLVYFGNQDQKARYLPLLDTGAKVAAYALTEPDAGSDALGIKTVARLSPDGRAYLLSGQKQWITNAGFADLFVVYARVDGEQMTAFLVERDSEGVSIGPEFKKMGIHGSSTCSVYLNNAPVPVENVLGQVGRGHIIAFNILNIGRWKLAAGCLGSCQAVLKTCAAYAQERRQFGRAIADFPAVQQKLAQMAARTFALESMVYRTAGLFDRSLAALTSGPDGGSGEAAGRAISEYAVEASINKIFGSETLDFVADEGVQIHGGYGYMQGFEVERAYRDARINRIFEGTNEINRLLIPGTLLRRANRGELPLLEAINRVQQEISNLAGPGRAGSGEAAASGPLSVEIAQLANLKRVALVIAGLGAQKYLDRAEEEQEFLLAIADLVVLVYAWESALLRVISLGQHESPEAAAQATDLALLFSEWVANQAEVTARQALAGMEDGDSLQMQLAILRRWMRRTPNNTVVLGRRAARRVLGRG